METSKVIRLRAKIETAANVGVIVVAICLAWSLYNYYESGGSGRSKTPGLSSGGKIQLAGVDWKANHKTVLVAVAPGCEFCEESASFFRLLARDVNNGHGSKLIFLLPESAFDGDEYLDHLGVGGSSFVRASFKSLGIAGTPTILLADGGGIASKVWTGKLRDDQIPEVLNSISDPPSIERIRAGQLKEALSAGRLPVVVDVSDRQEYAAAHIPGARNIPVDELQSRALREVPDQGEVVLYCGCPEDQLSIIGAKILKTGFDGGYTGVVVLDGGLKAWQASGFPTESKVLTVYNQ